MKYLLNGVAVAAALAIAAPVWAQAPQGGAPMTPAPAQPMAAAPAGGAMPMQHAKPMRHAKHMNMKMKKRWAKRGGKRTFSADDRMTEDLNRQELARLQGGGGQMAAPPPMGMPPGGAGQGGPRASGR